MAKTVETLMESSFWNGKRVFVTGHTGFKGSWLCLWLASMGAEVTGFALAAQGQPQLFHISGADRDVRSVISDIRNREHLASAISIAQPEIIFHMAAQPLVRQSYSNPVETYEINVLGTAYLLEAVRNALGRGIHIRALVNVTTDKCYENKEWEWGYRETDTLGGYDPYSSSKACSELVTASYRRSFFSPQLHQVHGLGIATARAGNVIGGGDASLDRLVPDCLRAFSTGQEVSIRSPRATRPWQHVLEPLSGYLLLARRLFENGSDYASAWNFGPDEKSVVSVERLVHSLSELWGNEAKYDVDTTLQPHEAHDLKLDSSRARRILGWRPRWTVETALEKTVEWHRFWLAKEDIRELCLQQIKDFTTHQEA